MKIFKLKCPSCGATLESVERIMYCSYCGEKLLLDDGAENINFTYREYDEARIRENERKEKIRLKELENEEKEKDRKDRTDKIILVFFCIIIGSYFFMGGPSKLKASEVKIPFSSEEYKGDNFEQVMKELKNAGFTEIEIVEQKDLVIGLLTKDGSIERISIAGDSEFIEGEIFSKDARVVITYHTFKKEKNE